MTAPMKVDETGSEALARELREDPPRMDDLRRARLERRIVAKRRGDAAVSQGLPAIPSSERPSSERPHALEQHPGRRQRGTWVALGALAAAALLGFFLRGLITDGHGLPNGSTPGSLARVDGQADDHGASHAGHAAGHAGSGRVGGGHAGEEHAGAEHAGDGELAAAVYTIASGFETREGTLVEGSRMGLSAHDEARLALGHVTAELSDGAQVEVRSLDPSDVRLVLEVGTGSFAFHPTHRGEEHLRVVTPSADVEVVGTVFTVEVGTAGTRVAVREGTVRVVPRTGEASLVHAGEQLEVAASAHDTLVESAPSTATAAVAPSATYDARAATERVGSGRHVTRTGESAGELANGELAHGELVSAERATTDVAARVTTESAEPEPWSETPPTRREIEAAWLRVDELQARHECENVLALLERLERFGPAADREMALFDRGFTLENCLRRPVSARVIYSRYVHLYPHGEHLQEVRARLVALGASPDGDAVSDETAREGLAEPE